MNKSLQSTLLAHCLLATLLAIGGCEQSEQGDAWQVETSFNVYEGAWFRILYPESFIPSPSLASTSAEGHDSVFFRSPDESAEFYVSSPQWGRSTPDIALVAAKETQVSEERSERDMEIVRSWTIVAKDSSYTRSYDEIASADGMMRQVFGFKYSDEAAYERYLPVYTRFKESLEQFAD